MTSKDTPNSGPIVFAALWAVVAVVVGIFVIVGAQNPDPDLIIALASPVEVAVNRATQALGWLIIATGALGLIVAVSRR